MKICIDVSQIQYVGTGVSSYTLQLVKHLLQNYPENEYTLFGGSLRRLSDIRQLTDGLQAKKIFIPLPATAQDMVFNRWGWMPIEWLVGQVDVFHATDWTLPSAHTASLVTTIHDLTVLKYPEYQHPQIIATHKRRLERVLKLKPQIIADSSATKKDILRLLKIDDDKRIHVVHLAASPDFLAFNHLKRLEKTEAIRKVRTKYNLNQYLLFVGTSEPRKNVANVIAAYKQLQQTHPHLELVLVGNYGWGPDHRTGPGVRVLGFVDQLELPALYAGATAFVYPSFYEGFGLPVLEAMTVGTPVVTSNKGSLAEVAEQGAAIVNPHQANSIVDGLMQVLHNPGEYKAKGLRQAAKFSWDKTAQQTWEVYQYAARHKVRR